MSEDFELELAIPFTQYLLPDGRRRDEEFICKNQDTYDKAMAFIQAGGKFECEVLLTGHVSLTAVYPFDEEEDDCAIEVCSNGPEVVKRVDRLVAKAFKVLQEHA